MSSFHLHCSLSLSAIRRGCVGRAARLFSIWYTQPQPHTMLQEVPYLATSVTRFLFDVHVQEQTVTGYLSSQANKPHQFNFLMNHFESLYLS